MKPKNLILFGYIQKKTFKMLAFHDMIDESSQWSLY